MFTSTRILRFSTRSWWRLALFLIVFHNETYYTCKSCVIPSLHADLCLSRMYAVASPPSSASHRSCTTAITRPQSPAVATTGQERSIRSRVCRCAVGKGTTLTVADSVDGSTGLAEGESMCLLPCLVMLRDRRAVLSLGFCIICTAGWLCANRRTPGFLHPLVFEFSMR